MEFIFALSPGLDINLRGDAAAFARDYRMLRVLEHRVQLRELRRTHLMPQTPEGLRVLARASHLASDGPGIWGLWGLAVAAGRLADDTAYPPSPTPSTRTPTSHVDPIFD